MEITSVGRWAFYGVAIGVPAALVGILFNWLMEFCQWATLESLANFHPPAPGGEALAGAEAAASGDEGSALIWALALLPAVGGLICGWIVFKFAPEAEGHGTDHVIDSYHNKRGVIRARVPLVKIIASSITIGTGGSAGREGPIAQVGAGIGSFLGQRLRLSDREKRVLLLCGAGAGIGAIFKAPLGGALFAAEVLYRDPEFEFESLIPCFISAIVAYSCYCPLAVTGWNPIFTIPDLKFDDPWQLPLYAALAVLVVVAGMVYIEIFRFFHSRVFGRMRIPKWLRPAVGGLGLGVVMVAFWITVRIVPGEHDPSQYIGAVLGMGYGYVQWAIDGQAGFGITIMLLLALAKIVATSLTITSGGSGGVFAPSLVIGGLVGGAFGQICHQAFPSVVGSEEIAAFVLVGMAGFFTGVAKVPLASMIMVSEMTSGYGLLTPLMLVVALAYVLSPRKLSIYDSQLNGRIDSPAHTGDFLTDVLEDINIRDVLRPAKPETIDADMFLSEILKKATQSRQSSFPVIDAEDNLIGVISLDDIRTVFLEPDLGNLVIARDIALTGQAPLYAGESLNSALRKFVQTHCEELPVLASEDEPMVIGMLNRRDLIMAYNQQMQERMKMKEA